MTDDVVKHALQLAAWQRDVPPKCRCAWTWHPDTQDWQRSDGATCGVHR